MIRVVHSWSGSRNQGLKRNLILDPDPQHWNVASLLLPLRMHWSLFAIWKTTSVCAQDLAERMSRQYLVLNREREDAFPLHFEDMMTGGASAARIQIKTMPPGTWNSWMTFLVEVSGRKLESRGFYPHFSVLRMLFMNRLEFSCFEDFLQEF